ncbi:hypothetical protein SCALM49S_05064 [Streptomyces californicus]
MLEAISWQPGDRLQHPHRGRSSVVTGYDPLQRTAGPAQRGEVRGQRAADASAASSGSGPPAVTPAIDRWTSDRLQQPCTTPGMLTTPPPHRGSRDDCSTLRRPALTTDVPASGSTFATSRAGGSTERCRRPESGPHVPSPAAIAGRGAVPSRSRRDADAGDHAARHQHNPEAPGERYSLQPPRSAAAPSDAGAARPGLGADPAAMPALARVAGRRCLRTRGGEDGMLLRRLTEYATRAEADGELPPPYYRPKRIQWILQISQDGTSATFEWTGARRRESGRRRQRLRTCTGRGRCRRPDPDGGHRSVRLRPGEAGSR